MSKVRYAVSGLEHPGWEEQYYPEDIPDDWKLAYYSNDFPAIVMTAEQALDDEFVDQLDDIPAGFRVYVLVNEELGGNQRAELEDVLGGYFGGFIVKNNDLANFAAHILAQPVEGPFQAPVEVVRIAKMPDLKQLKQYLLTLQSQLGQNDVLFWLDDEQVAIESFQQLKTLLELMAIA